MPLIVVIPFGITTSGIFLSAGTSNKLVFSALYSQPSTNEKFGLAGSTIMLARDVFLPKAESAMSSRAVGIVIDVIADPKNASPLIARTVSGEVKGPAALAAG